MNEKVASFDFTKFLYHLEVVVVVVFLTKGSNKNKIQISTCLLAGGKKIIMIKPDLIYLLFLFCLAVANNGRVYGKEITSRNISKRYGKKLIAFFFFCYLQTSNYQ